MSPKQQRQLILQIERAREKADRLLREGDALAQIKPAESRRLLRECRRYRAQTRALEAQLPNPTAQSG